MVPSITAWAFHGVQTVYNINSYRMPACTTLCFVCVQTYRATLFRGLRGVLFPPGRCGRRGAALPRAPHRTAAAPRGARVARHGRSTSTAVYLTVACFPGVPLRGSWAGVMAPAALAWAWLGAGYVRWSLHRAETCTGSRISALHAEKVLFLHAGTDPAGFSRLGMVVP